MRFLAILFVFLCLGFIRIFWFEHYNVYLYQTFYNKPRLDEQLFWMFRSFSYSTLYYFKIVFTIFFVAIFYCLSYLSFKWLGTASDRKPLQYTYTILIGTALVLGSLSWIENTRLQQIVYSINLWLMGIAESPLPFLLLWASRNLNPIPKSSVKNP